MMALRGITIQFYIECRQTAAVGAYTVVHSLYCVTSCC